MNNLVESFSWVESCFWFALEKRLYFSTTLLVIGIESCHQFFSEDEFLAPRNVSIERLVAGPAQLSWHDFEKQGNFRQTFILPFCKKNVKLLPIGIWDFPSQYKKSLSKFGFYSICSFGLTHKHLIRFGVVKATFWCEFVKDRLLQKSFALRRCHTHL